MAEDKDKDKEGNELLGQDFLGDMQKNVDSMPTTGLFDKLAKLGAQQRLQPLADQRRLESSYKPLLKMVQDAEDRVTAGMLAHKLANPDIDDSKLHSGVGDLVTNTMTENNARFKELNRQLAYMSPRNPKYADLVGEIANINKNSLGLRDQNAKLMEIKNTMNHKDFDIKEMSLGNAPGVKNMYSDIQKGVSDNFQTIDGKLYWVDPNPDIAEDDPAKKVSVESIKALAPEMTFGEAYVQHNGMLSAVSDMPVDSPNYDQNLHFNVSTMFTEIGDAGVKSLIFDSENSEEDDAGNLVGWSNGGDMFNTSNWFESFYSDLGVTDTNTMIDIRQAIQKNGVTHKITGADGKERKVIDHFRKWYTDELKKVEKSEKGKPKESTTPLDDFEDDRDDGDNGGNGDIKVELPETDSDNNYKGQTGSGENRYANSPFSGLTQYGWSAVADIDVNDILFNYGDGDLVVNTLTNNYSSYGFTFKESEFNNIEDELTVIYENPNDPDDPKNGKKITIEFDNTRAKPLNDLNESMFGVKDKDEDEAKKLKEWMETMINWSAPKK